MSFDGPAFRRGILVGPLLALVSLLVLMATDLGLGVWLLVCVLWPCAAALLLVLIRRDERMRWLWTAAGALLGTTLAVGFVLGGISSIAYLLSDPAGR